MRIVHIALVLLAVAHSSALAEQRFAVVIGANPGWSGDRPLRYAENDAERVRDVLVALGGFASDRVVLLRDPDTADVRATLRDLSRHAQNSSEETLIFFYYSGHADDKHLHMRGDPLTHKELQQTLRSLPSTIKLAVIDACKSGAVTRKGGSKVDEFEVSVDNPKLSGMVIITSSGADELSQESRALTGSVFTHHLVSGLRGAADGDNDKQVTISEAYHYAYGRTRADTAATGVPQRPSFRYELSGQGELVLASLKTARTASVTVPKGGATKYVVLDQHEWRLVAEAKGEKDRDVALYMPPGSYKIKRIFTDRIEVGSVTLVAGDKTPLDNLAFKSAPLSQGVVKGDPNQLDPQERREWMRTQGFGLLASGQANAALNIFDQLLREANDDVLAWRGRARALVRIAEAYQKVNDTMRERLSLNDALKADPSLTNDPMFVIWYQRLGELDARAQATFDAKQKFVTEVKQNPRTTKRFGMGFDLLSARGFFTVGGRALIHRAVSVHAALDLGTQGLDAGFVLAPYPSRWSPFLGVGGHVAFRELGVEWGDGGPPMATANGEPVDTGAIWGAHFRAEVGAQFVGRSGFTTELGFALMLYTDREGKRSQKGWPIIHFGWMF